MKILLSTILFFISIQFSYSQDDFVKGFIVNKSKDTIRGFIQRTIEEDLFLKVNFRENLSSPPSTLLPGEIE